MPLAELRVSTTVLLLITFTVPAGRYLITIVGCCCHECLSAAQPIVLL